MPDVKDTYTIIDSLHRCCHAGDYADTGRGDTCIDCAYYGKCCDLELDAAELILLLDELTGHQFKIDRYALIDLSHCKGCSETKYHCRCRVYNMYGSKGCDKIQEDAADILEKIYHRYNIMRALRHCGRCDGPERATEILTDTAAIGQRIKDYIQRNILARGYCTAEDVSRRAGVRAVQVPGIGWPLRRVGWVKMPEITFRKDSIEDFWRIQIDDPVLLSLERVKAAKTECQNRPFFVKSPGGTWEPINDGIEPLIDTSPCDGFRGGKIYDIKPIRKEDIMESATLSEFMAKFLGYTPDEIRERNRKRFECAFVPKSIEQSADHKTVVVLWADDSKTIVRLSDNDKDDIDTAFAYALAKTIFGTNTHLKKVVRQKLNEHKPKIKRLPPDPNPKEIPVDFEYIKDAKELFLESHSIDDVQINIDLTDTGWVRVHMYTPLEGIIEYMKNVESTQDALSKLESMWQHFNTEKEE